MCPQIFPTQLLVNKEDKSNNVWARTSPWNAVQRIRKFKSFFFRGHHSGHCRTGANYYKTWASPAYCYVLVLPLPSHEPEQNYVGHRGRMAQAAWRSSAAGTHCLGCEAAQGKRSIVLGVSWTICFRQDRAHGPHQDQAVLGRKGKKKPQ